MNWIPARAARLIAACWPALLSYYLAGYLAHHLLISLASWIGASSGLAAFFVLPLAVLAKLLGFIAMFFTLRRHMPELTALSPVPPRLTAVISTSILPFLAFYAAWGYLDTDITNYTIGALRQAWGPTDPLFGRGMAVGLNLLTVAITAIAFGARSLLKRYAAKLPRWTKVLSAYLEAVWLFLAIVFVKQAIALGTSWLGGRALVAWWNELLASIGAAFAPLRWLADAANWAIAEAGGLLLLPLAWLTLAGVVYGRTIAAPTLTLAPRDGQIGEIYRRAGAKASSVPKWVRDRAKELWAGVIARFKPIVSSLLLIWHAGAVPLGVFVLNYSVLLAIGNWVRFAIPRVLGPQSIDFWFATSPLVSFAATVVFEPLLIAFVAAAYDYSLKDSPAAQAEERRQLLSNHDPER